MTTLQTVAFGLATGSGMALLYVAIHNWRVLISGVRRPERSRPSLVFLAGPILVVLLVQALHLAGAPLSPRGLLLVALLGLAVDPAALPAATYVLFRWARTRLTG